MKKVLIIHPEGNINNNPNLSGIVRNLCESGERGDICSRKVKTIDQEFHCEGARLFLVDKKVSATDGFVILAGLSPDYKQRHHFIHETIGDYDLVVGVDRGIIEASEIAQVKRTPLGLISYEIYFVAEAGNDFKQPEIEACRNIDFAVCQDELRAGFLSVENRILLEKIINIPLGGRFVRKGSKSSYLYDSLGIEKNKKIALFAGSLGRWSMTDYLIETAKTWSNDWVLVLHNRYKLDEDTLTYYQERKGLSDNVHFSLEPVTDVSEVGRILHSANIGVALYQAQSNSIQEGNNLRYVGMASGKVATYLQHGLPVVVNDIGEMSDYVRKNNLGLVVDKNSPFKIDVKSGELIQWSENCYRFFEEKLDLNKTILPLLEKIQSLIGKDSTTTVFTFDSNKDRPQRQLLLNHTAGAESGSADKVDISLILCTKDRAQLLDEMLASLNNAVKGVSCEVIVVEGGSSDNTQEVLLKHGITKVYSEAECLGPGRHSWPQLYNFGFSKARGKWAMYASDDIVFGKECIANAVKSLNSQKDEVAGGIFFFKNIYESPDEEEFGAEKFFVGMDRGWKMLLNYGLFRLDYFREVGGLDEAYRFYCADGDLGCKFYDSGKQLIPLPQCLVVHNNVLDQLKKKNQERISSDYSLYLQRWGHFAPGEQGPGRLIWQEDFVEAFNLPFDLEKINWGIEYFWQGLACLQRGMFEKALGKFSQAMRNGCCHWKVLWYSAKAVYGCGEVEVAKKIARTVVKFAPEFIQAKEFLTNLSMSNSSSFLTREPKMFSHGQTSPALLNIEQFEKQINPVTWQRHDKILQWAQSCEAAPQRFELQELYENSDDPVVRQGFELTGKVKQQFRGRYKHLKDLRILVHIPSLRFSPAGYSLFTNMVQGLEVIGIPVRMLGWNETIDKLLYEFRPTVFLTSDHEGYLSRINWDSVKKYRESNTLRIGLTASIEEYGNTALQERLLWAKQQRVDFYYSFRCPEYLRRRTEYRPFFENGYNIFSVEFGANPLIHYAVPSIERDLNYVFLASANSEKWPRYFSYLSEIFSKYPGFLDGPGWPFIQTKSASFSKDRYLYARAKVGLNLHLDEQINWANELNERTYILAACGVPQLVDNPKLLPQRFDENAFFVAKGPDEYTALFAYILNNPVEARKKALIAQREVFTKHTWFHRAEGLVLDLMRNYFPKSQQHGLLYNSDLHSQVNRKICGRVARIGGSVKQLLEYKNCEVQDINLMDGGFGRVPPNSNTIIIDMHNVCHEPWLMNRYDCSISSNVIEHSYNPVALLLNFYFITKKGGYQFHAIPNCRYTYDSYRKPTSLVHLIDDFEKMTDKSDTSHNEDYIQSAIIKDGWQREFHKKYPLTYPYIHFHVFDEYNTKELMEFIFQDVMIDVIKTRQFSDVLVLFRNVLNPKFVGKYRNLINQYSQRIPMSDDNVLNKIERGNHISSISEFQSEPETWSQRHQNIELPGTLLQSAKNDLRKATLESHCNTLAQLKSLNLWKEGEPIRLHLGCGGQRLNGYINIDYPPSEHNIIRVKADIYADIKSLYFPPESVDEIRLHHVFEHFNRGNALALLVRWHEWLKVGGKLHIETPDVFGSAKMLASNVSYKIKQGILRHIFGSHEADWAYHYDGWYEDKFRRILSSLGFEVTCHTSQWQREPYLANVEVFAIKRRNMSREQLLTVCDQLLLDSKVDDIPAERKMHEIWMKDVRAFLDNTRSAQTVSVQNI